MSNIISLYKFNIIYNIGDIVNNIGEVFCYRKHYIELAYEKRLIIEGTSKVTLYFSLIYKYYIHSTLYQKNKSAPRTVVLLYRNFTNIDS